MAFISPIPLEPPVTTTRTFFPATENRDDEVLVVSMTVVVVVNFGQDRQYAVLFLVVSGEAEANANKS